MRIHFSSQKECFLRLGGVLMGSCGKVEKFIDMEQNSELLVEFLPVDGNLLPLCFVINAAFFQNPPSCIQLYQYGIGVDIVAAHFQPRVADLQVLEQKRVGNLLATFVKQQNMQLLLENNKTFANLALPLVDSYTLEEIQLAATPLLLFTYQKDGKKMLLVYNQNCKLLLKQEYSSYTITENLQLTLKYNNVAQYTLQQSYVLEKDGLHCKQESLQADENFAIENLHARLFPFAFFQAMLIGADIKDYLAPTLQDKQTLLKEYLGQFIDVQIPKDIFYHVYGEVNAVALIYQKAETVFEIKFFTLQLENGKICNLQIVDSPIA